MEKPGSGSVRGTTLLVLSAIAFSSAGFFTRMAPIDLWAMIFWRNLFGAAALALIVAFSLRRSPGRNWKIGRQQLAVIAFSSFGTLTYLAAFKYTSVANISIIYAAAPLVTAALAWVWLREKMARKTLIASLIALLGVGLTVSHSLEAGTGFGDALALLMTVSLSVMTVAARGNQAPALVMSLLASTTAGLIVLPLGYAEGASFAITAADAFWLAGFGTATMAIALPCYLAGAAQVPAGRAMLISALEMPLAPLWVLLVFGETPATASVFGGILVACAIFYELRAGKPASASTEGVRDPAINRVARKAVAEVPADQTVSRR
jgi:drug/metabolite transporter (DMT)-like permease